jgi:crossover junction endodeoxyribonuclease RuvC
MSVASPWCSRVSVISGTNSIILGVDPGLRRTGFGVIDNSGSQARWVASGVIKVPDGALSNRLRCIHESLAEVIDKFQPDQACIEIVFVNVNPASTLLLGQARGAAITALACADLDVAEYTALQIKQSVTGHGKANKSQVQDMVQRLLNLPSLPSADAADALACALTHAQATKQLALSRQTQNSLQGLKLKGGRLVPISRRLA